MAFCAAAVSGCTVDSGSSGSTVDSGSNAEEFMSVLLVEADVSTIGGEATVIDVKVITNVDYEISIPDDAKGWISVVERTKSVLTTETVRLAVSEYKEGPVRSATVCFMVEGKEAASVYIEQTSLWEDMKNVPIDFADLRVKEILLNSDNPVIDVNYDREISYEEAAACTRLSEFGLTSIISFNELKYFTALSTIGEDAFYGCSDLRSIELPASLTSIGGGAFCGCSSLSSIELPASLTSLGNYAFYECSSLESIDLPESLTSIGDNTFAGCSSLESIDLPESLTSIGNWAFWGCSSLSSIELPASLTKIERNAFRICSSLSSIELPASLTKIENTAFCGCSSLREIAFNSELPPEIQYDTFSGCKIYTVYIPEYASFDSYKSVLNSLKGFENATIRQ